VRRLAKAGLWSIAPTYAMWREVKSVAPRPIEPFRRWMPIAVSLYALYMLAGGLAIAVALRFDVPILPLFGALFTFAGACKLAARVLIPRRWVPTEADFVTLTSLQPVTRLALWAAFFASLIRADWTAAFALGVAAALLSLGSALTVLVAKWIALRSAARL